MEIIQNTDIRKRLEKALNQRLYLIDVTKNSERDWLFKVEGSTGIIYDVTINDSLKCTCPDFTTRCLICKHIYFIIARVLKNISIINDIGSEPNICIFSLRGFVSENFDNALNPRFHHETLNHDDPRRIKFDSLISEKMCSICYEDFTDDVLLVKCSVCKHYFHSNCMAVWLRKAPTSSCVLCRSSWL